MDRYIIQYETADGVEVDVVHARDGGHALALAREQWLIMAGEDMYSVNDGS